MDDSILKPARMEISVYPIGTDNPDISADIFPIIEIIERSGLAYQVTTTCTIVEGETGRLFALAEKVHRASFRDGIKRVLTLIKIDETC